MFRLRFVTNEGAAPSYYEIQLTAFTSANATAARTILYVSRNDAIAQKALCKSHSAEVIVKKKT